MTNPVVVEIWRGDMVESRHRGGAVVMNADGDVVRRLGDIDAAIFPRSAVKPFQAMPFVESGAFDALGIGSESVALACGSHSGEDGHVALAADMLARIGLDDQALELAAHDPVDPAAARALSAQGKAPGRLHNNCSGKHAAFLALAHRSGWPTESYVGADHPVQRAARASVEQWTGAALASAPCAIDGCAIPTYALSLAELARGYARLAVATDPAATCVRTAMMTHAWHVAGTGRFDTDAMRRASGRLVVKTGAEGVYGIALPEQGLGIALKIDDGTARASIALAAALIDPYLPGLGIAALGAPPITAWDGSPVGTTRVTPTRQDD